jgi:hypothetical protein
LHDFIIATERDEPLRNPCEPSPCGPNSKCRVTNGHAVCSCITGYVGTPPTCRPECVISADCSQDRACLNQKCRDPCPGNCGINARCHVINHNPICTCTPGYNGDPFVKCHKEISKEKLSYLKTIRILKKYYHNIICFYNILYVCKIA